MRDPLRIEHALAGAHQGRLLPVAARCSPAPSRASTGAVDSSARSGRTAPLSTALPRRPCRDRGRRVYSWWAATSPARWRGGRPPRSEAGFTARQDERRRPTAPPCPTPAEIDDVVRLARPARQGVLGDHSRRGRRLPRPAGAAARSAASSPSSRAPLRPLVRGGAAASEQGHALHDVVTCSPIPIATARAALRPRRSFLGPLRAGVAVVQPDLSHAGGISEVRRIAASPRPTPFSRRTARSARSPLAASAQVAFATPNFLILGTERRHPTTTRRRTSSTTSSTPSRSASSTGTMRRMDAPGLGITWTRRRSARADRTATPGATRSGTRRRLLRRMVTGRRRRTALRDRWAGDAPLHVPHRPQGSHRPHGPHTDHKDECRANALTFRDPTSSTLGETIVSLYVQGSASDSASCLAKSIAGRRRTVAIGLAVAVRAARDDLPGRSDPFGVGSTAPCAARAWTSVT
ncbi:enolase C-terminal domain-like protein [Streptosporangium vulgare]|uniref:enolase C-terminal domain-like protein n=1 Tax=Streptosporangium vulgare TaxID=46190 RepID=UPI003CD09E44